MYRMHKYSYVLRQISAKFVNNNKYRRRQPISSQKEERKKKAPYIHMQYVRTTNRLQSSLNRKGDKLIVKLKINMEFSWDFYFFGCASATSWEGEAESALAPWGIVPSREG